MICPRCGEAVDERWQSCPSCGSYLYEEHEEPTGEMGIPDYGSSGNKTSIVAVDPEFQKGTRIVANPLLESSTRKRARDPKPAPSPVPENDALGSLMYNFWTVHGRLNFLEKGALWLLVGAVVFCFMPWYRDTRYDIWISGYERDGLYAALMGAVSALFLLIRIGMRLGIWAQLLHLVLLFGASSLCTYLFVAGNPPEREFLPFFYIGFFSFASALLAAFLGAMKRFLS